MNISFKCHCGRVNDIETPNDGLFIRNMNDEEGLQNEVGETTRFHLAECSVCRSQYQFAINATVHSYLLSKG